MDSIKVQASAKVNLSLDVTGKRNDGYHNIESIFQSINIYDTITVSKISNPLIEISCNDPVIPCGKTNIVYKAAKLFFEKTGISHGISIYIEKKIPSQSGLGGGSSDGAAVLYALNILFGAELDGRELTTLGGKISADTAFFTVGGTAFASGIGDVIEPIRYIPNVDMVVSKGYSSISTPTAYQKIDMLTNPRHPKTDNLLKAIDKGKFMSNCDLCENIFESVTDLDDVNEIKRKMIRYGALTSLMSGSGSAVFGIFESSKEAIKCAELLNEDYPFCIHCKATANSIVL